jgi:hypothetical protein
MKKIMFLVLAVAAGAAHADTKKHETRYCAALTSLKGDLKQLDALTQDSKVGEVHGIVNRIDKDSKTVEKEASKIKTPAGKQFTASANRLVNETQSIPEDMTIAQVKARIEDDASNLKQSAMTLSTEAGCPEAMPDSTPSDETHTQPGY